MFDVKVHEKLSKWGWSMSERACARYEITHYDVLVGVATKKFFRAHARTTRATSSLKSWLRHWKRPD